MSRLERARDVRTMIERLASEGFAGFELKYDASTLSWSCRNPHHGNHAFSLYFAPGIILMWGDIGEYVWVVNDRNTLQWYLDQGAKAGDYPDYFLGKCRATNEPGTREFYVGDAYAYIDERIADINAEWNAEVQAITHDDEDPDYANRQSADLAEEYSKKRKPWNELRAKFGELLSEQLNEERTCWYLACCDVLGDSDPPACTGWTGHALWAWHAARTFARLHAAMVASCAMDPATSTEAVS